MRADGVELIALAAPLNDGPPLSQSHALVHLSLTLLCGGGMGRRVTYIRIPAGSPARPSRLQSKLTTTTECVHALAGQRRKPMDVSALLVSSRPPVRTDGPGQSQRWTRPSGRMNRSRCTTDTSSSEASLLAPAPVARSFLRSDSKLLDQGRKQPQRSGPRLERWSRRQRIRPHHSLALDWE